MATILTNLRGTSQYGLLFRFMNELRYAPMVKSSYAPKRLEKWFGYHSNLQSIENGNHVLGIAEKIPEVFNTIQKQYYPEADSILLCAGTKPESDTSISPHRDHGSFKAKAVMINFGDSIYIEKNRNGDTRKYDLQDGDVIEIDTKLIHSSEQISRFRMNATLRKVRPEFLKQEKKPLF